jgi:gamma-glutamyltranspeptidase
VNAQILARVLALGEDPRTAMIEPRWAVFPGTIPADIVGSADAVVLCEPGLPCDVVEALLEAGYPAAPLAEYEIGSAKWVMRTGADAITAFADRRRDGAVEAE